MKKREREIVCERARERAVLDGVVCCVHVVMLPVTGFCAFQTTLLRTG